MTTKYFVAIDRDGTLIEDVHYLQKPEQIKIIPGAIEAIKKLNEIGCGIVVVSNQSGIGRGYFTLEDVLKVHHHLIRLLEEQNAFLNGIYFCPHAPEDNCACRKPKDGLIRTAASDWKFSPEHCVVIGDKLCDMELGRGVGAKTIMVRTGYGRRICETEEVDCDYIAEDILEAADLIVNKFDWLNRSSS